jgi:hypothetical protein
VGLVKTVTLQITGEIRDAAAKIGLISKEAQALADKSPVELKAELTGSEQVKARLAEIDARAEELKKNFPEFTAKIDIGTASAKLAILRREIRGTSRAAGSGGGGLLGAVEGLIGSGGAAAGAGGAAGGFGMAGLAVVIGEVSGALAAATIGIGSFAALAFPTLSEISKGYGNITKDTLAYNRATSAAAKSTALKHMKDDWAGLDPGVQGAIKGVQGFVDLWHKLAKALEPDVLKLFNEGLRIANKLLPDLLPFAKAAAGALDGLLRNFGKFADSAGFKAFQAQMLKLSGPAITALGLGFGKIAIAVGKLLLAMAKPQGIAALNRLLGFTADAIGALSWFINRGIGNWQKWIDILHQTANKFDEFRHDFAIGAHEIAVHFDGMRHAAADWAHNLAAWFDEVRHNIATWAHDVANTFSQWRHDTAQKADAMVSFFIRIPGRIRDALAGLPAALAGPFRAAMRIIGGIFRTILGWIHTITGFLGGHGGGDPGGSAGANMVIARRMMPAWSTGSQWASWVQLNNRECVPLRTRILTRRGWLSHDEVRVGDETIGYDAEKKASTWTRVTRIVHYEQAETVRFGNGYWSAECTPEHRWLTERMHASRTTEARSESFTETRDLRRLDRVVLARPADLGGSLPITVNEAALLGWIAGDGTVAEPREYFYDRKPEQEATAEAPYGYRRDGQPKKNRSGAPRKSGQHRKVSQLGLVIVQSKQEHFGAIEQACADAPSVGRGIQPGRGAVRDLHVWRLSAAYARDLLARAGHPKRDAVAQVLAMSPEQRGAWLEAMICAEGSRSEGRTRLYQDDGPVADAIEMAIYLSGRRPSRTKDKRGEGKTWAIRSVSPNIGGPGRRSFTEDAGRQDVWCVTTQNGSWTAEQDGQVFLSSNSGWNRFAENPQSGAYGIPQALPPTKMPFAAQKAGGSNASAQLGWQIGYIRQRYGTPANAWGFHLAHGWYDSGVSYLPTGPSIAWNMTGRPERVGGEDLGPLLRKIIKQNGRVIALLETAPAAQAQATTRALNGLRVPVTRPRGG